MSCICNSSRIANADLSVLVNHLGAELSSIKDVKGTEYMWQGDASVWPRQSPHLFPIIGRLKNDAFSYEGELYALTSHGFARDMEFELVSESERSLRFKLSATDATRISYPFEFVLYVNYELIGSQLRVSYEVENHGDCVMPFSLGAHPGFALSWKWGDPIEDYYLEFDKDSTLRSNLLNADVLMTSDTQVFLDKSKVLPITKTLFERNSLNVLKHDLRTVTLCSRTSDNRLTVDVSEFSQLGLWAKPGASYVCIEPWLGHADYCCSNGIFMNKPGTLKLVGGARHVCAYSITIG